MKRDIVRYIELMGRRQKEFFSIAREGLLKIGLPACKQLARVLLTHRNSFARRHAAMILGELGDKTALKPLIKALDDRMPAVRWSAAIALGLLKDPRAVPTLKKQLRSNVWQLRVNSAISLGWIGDKRALRSLLRLLNDSNKMVRRAAAFALSKFDRFMVRDALMKILLRGKNPSIEAALSLTFMGELMGYYTLGMAPPTMIWEIPRAEKSIACCFKKGNRGNNIPRLVKEAVSLGNLFVRSGIYPQAIAEYRKAVAMLQNVSSPLVDRFIAALLNNMGCLFRGLGHLEQGYFFFTLAQKLDPKRKEITQNTVIAETLLEMREVISDRIQYYLKLNNDINKLPKDVMDFLSRLFLSKEHCYYNEREADLAVEGVLRSFFMLGYRVYNAFLAFKGEENIERGISLPPIEFLEEQLPTLELLFEKEEPFVMYKDLLLCLLDKFRRNLFVKNSTYNKLDKLVPLDTANLVFLRGFFVGFLEKIWQTLHHPISLN